MHKFFSEWYRVVSLQPDGALLEKRWQGIEKAVQSADFSGMLELIRIFFSIPVKDNEYAERYRLVFQGIDPAFMMRGNDLEVAVLSGASIVHCLEARKPEYADAIALASIAANCKGMRTQPPIPEVIMLCEQHLSQRSAQLRSLGPVPEIVPLDLTETYDANSGAQLRQFAESAVSAIGYLHRKMQLQEEETNILWWLFGGHSRDMDKRMADVGLPAACLVIGKELADLTLILPGPLSATAFMDKMFLSIKQENRKQTTIKDAVNACPREWRTKWISKRDIQSIDDFCPIHLAVSKSLQTDGTVDWLPAYEKSAGVEVKSRIDPLEIAMQVYHESLFFSASKQLLR